MSSRAQHLPVWATACSAFLVSLHNSQGSRTSFLATVSVLDCSYTVARGQQLLCYTAFQLSPLCGILWDSCSW